MVVTTAAVATLLLGGALTASLLTTGGSSTGRVVDGNAVEYTVGHRPLVPGLTATSLTGKTIKMSSYQGKIVVLNFWESSCAPCRAEAPALEAAYQQYQPRGVDFLGDDVGDTPVNALAFVHSERISYPSVNDPDYAFVQQFSRAAPVSATPTTMVIDRTGHVVGTILGMISDGQLATLLRQAGAGAASRTTTLVLSDRHARYSTYNQIKSDSMYS